MLRVGDRVSALATIFDDKSHSWSKSVFGGYWEKARCFGTVVKIKSSKSLMVKWDMDGKITNVSSDNVELHSIPTDDGPEEFIETDTGNDDGKSDDAGNSTSDLGQLSLNSKNNEKEIRQSNSLNKKKTTQKSNDDLESVVESTEDKIHGNDEHLAKSDNVRNSTSKKRHKSPSNCKNNGTRIRQSNKKKTAQKSKDDPESLVELIENRVDVAGKDEHLAKSNDARNSAGDKPCKTSSNSKNNGTRIRQSNKKKTAQKPNDDSGESLVEPTKNRVDGNDKHLAKSNNARNSTSKKRRKSLLNCENKKKRSRLSNLSNEKKTPQVSNEDPEVDDGANNPETSVGVRTQTIDSSSSDDSSSDSDESSMGSYVEDEVDEVCVHDTAWRFQVEKRVDEYGHGVYGPKLLQQIPNIETASEKDFWLLFFVEADFLTRIVEFTNMHPSMRQKPIDTRELLKFFGIMYAMTLHQLGNRRTFWSVDAEYNLFPPLAFGKNLTMGLHRFENILAALSFRNRTVACEDKWMEVRPLVDALNDKWTRIIHPGHKVTADESMFAWLGRDQYDSRGMPAVMKIKRKPKGVGCEVKSLADSRSRIMIQMEINEGKEEMSKKAWTKDYGAGTSVLLRLCRPWFASGRIVIADSWFGSVKSADQLFRRGLFFTGMVKTATRNFPLKELQRRCPPNRGDSIAAVADVEGAKMLAMAWRDKKIHTVVSTCGTTFPGSPAEKKRTDENGKTFTKFVPRPALFEHYFDGAPAIDIHNHLRQSGLSLETSWGTQTWYHRLFASLFGIIETNAFLAYNYFGKHTVSHRDFTGRLARQLIFGDTGTSGASPSFYAANNHVLKPLSELDERGRRRVQRKCVICSRRNNIQQKASFFCAHCGPNAVLCSPQTQRDYFSWHVENGLL